MLRSKVSKIRVTLNKSPGYKGLQETPPSQPEAGVPLLRSREVRLHYVQDVPGAIYYNLQCALGSGHCAVFSGHYTLDSKCQTCIRGLFC